MNFINRKLFNIYVFTSTKFNWSCDFISFSINWERSKVWGLMALKMFQCKDSDQTSVTWFWFYLYLPQMVKEASIFIIHKFWTLIPFSKKHFGLQYIWRRNVCNQFLFWRQFVRDGYFQNRLVQSLYVNIDLLLLVSGRQGGKTVISNQIKWICWPWCVQSTVGWVTATQARLARLERLLRARWPPYSAPRRTRLPGSR